MSPKKICPKCGREQMFHDDEVKDKQAICVECTLEHGYNVFLAEVLEGQHPELVEQLKEKLAEEGGWE
jgi:ribosomal protein S27AE